MQFKAAVSIILASCMAAQADLRSERYRKLTGAQIRAAFAGRTFSDDVHYSFRYTPAGAIEGMGMGTKVARKWRIQNDELCQTDIAGENCFAIWRKGREIKFVIGDDGVFMEGTLK